MSITVSAPVVAVPLYGALAEANSDDIAGAVAGGFVIAYVTTNHPSGRLESCTPASTIRPPPISITVSSPSCDRL